MKGSDSVPVRAEWANAHPSISQKSPESVLLTFGGSCQKSNHSADSTRVGTLLLQQLFHSEPVHCASDTTFFVKGAANFENVPLNLHRAIIGLAVARIVD